MASPNNREFTTDMLGRADPQNAVKLIRMDLFQLESNHEWASLFDGQLSFNMLPKHRMEYILSVTEKHKIIVEKTERTNHLDCGVNSDWI